MYLYLGNKEMNLVSNQANKFCLLHIIYIHQACNIKLKTSANTAQIK